MKLIGKNNEKVCEGVVLPKPYVLYENAERTISIIKLKHVRI
jgi:hypothetical protein